ncbi:MAG: hypothetical protein NZX77_02500 [Polyangiaceae bacterium]|nr:hypothetical protein [Polyangiaceae bacterium]
MTKSPSLLLLLALLVLAECSKGESTPAGVTSSKAVVSAPPTPASSASATTPAKPEEAPLSTWKGTFKSRPGNVTLSKEAAEAIKVWSKDPGKEMVGDGTISLWLPVSKGLVRGEIRGALGDLLVNGELEDDQFRARVDPKDPNDPKAMTGILHGKRRGDSWEGMLRVASRNANLVREAEFKLTQ